MKRALVIGSGAGGATAARELQGAFDVTVLEAGEEFRRKKKLRREEKLCLGWKKSNRQRNCPYPLLNHTFTIPRDTVRKMSVR